MSAVGISPSVLVAAPSKGYKTAADLIAAAKAKPGELNFASAGIGAASHLAAEKFSVAAGIKAQHIPFKGPVEALTEVMAGRIDYYFLPLAPALANIRSGKVAGAGGEFGQARADACRKCRPSARSVCRPRSMRSGTACSFRPRPRKRSSTGCIRKPRRRSPTPAVKERLAKLGIEPLVMSQPEFEKYFKADVVDTEKLAKAAGIESSTVLPVGEPPGATGPRPPRRAPARSRQHQSLGR